MGYRSFEELEVWKLGCRLAVRVYEVLKDCRDFGLKDQMTRAAVSRNLEEAYYPMAEDIVQAVRKVCGRFGP
ncbi:MAG: four helix bundle protein [Syntrophales bacterium]|nr:four helix bundle protein [Syntrophales bacterium]